MTTQNQELAQTIIDQMGGTGKLKAMIGAHNFVCGDDIMGFKFKGYRKANLLQIRLESTDTYEMKLSNITKSYKYTEIYKQGGLYNDMLKDIFEEKTGLRLSL